MISTQWEHEKYDDHLVFYEGKLALEFNIGNVTYSPK